MLFRMFPYLPLSGARDMTARIRQEQRSGQLVVVKRATEPAQRSALQREAHALGSLRHPGVIDVIEYTTGVGHDELTTDHAGSVTLADLHPANMGSIAGVLADLHAAGPSHQRLAPDHVIIGASRRPTLCSFSEASQATADAVAADMAAVGDLIDALTSSARSARRQHNALAHVAAACGAPGANAIDIARRLANVPGSIAQEANGRCTDPPPLPAADRPATSPDLAMTTGRLVRPTSSALESTRTWRDRVQPIRAATQSKRALVAAMLGALALIASGLAALSIHNSVAVTVAADSATTPTSPPAEPPSAAAATRPTSLADALPEVVRHGCPAGTFDIDGNGCDDKIEIYANVLRVNDTWFQAGDPGDVVAIDDWDCDGRFTPAILRPTTGAVFVFAAWTAAGGALEVPASALHAGATHIEAVERDGCHDLVLIHSTGERLPEPVAGT
jgi:hypothetical protein